LQIRTELGSNQRPPA